MSGDNFKVLATLAAFGVAFLLICPQPRLLIFRILALPILFVLFALGWLGMLSVELGQRILAGLECGIDPYGLRRSAKEFQDSFSKTRK